jgi:hypothetical protein
MSILENLSMQSNNLVCSCFGNFNSKNNYIQFKDEHPLRPSSFPNGSVCGHLREIRSINFDPQNYNINYRKINIKPVNLKIR